MTVLFFTVIAHSMGGLGTGELHLLLRRYYALLVVRGSSCFSRILVRVGCGKGGRSAAWAINVHGRNLLCRGPSCTGVPFWGQIN